MNDLELLQHLTVQQRETYMNLQRLFDSPGWEIVKGWAKANADDAERRQLTASNWDQTNVARGAVYAFRLLESLETATDAEYAALAEQAKERITQSDEEEHE